MPDPHQPTQEFQLFCAARGHDDVASLSKPLLRSLAKLFHEQRQLEAANRDAFGDNLPDRD